MRNAAGQNISLPPYLLVIFFIAILWQLLWKGIALWRAAGQKQRNWFVVLFVFIPLNDLGILEIVYLFRFSKKRMTIAEVKHTFLDFVSLFKRS